jgi:transcriptional regulator with XRE-family HTH domain
LSMTNQSIMNLHEFTNLTVGELFKLTGIHKSQWSRYIAGNYPMSESTLKKAAEALGMPASSVLRGIEIRRELITNASSNDSLKISGVSKGTNDDIPSHEASVP